MASSEDYLTRGPWHRPLKRTTSLSISGCPRGDKLQKTSTAAGVSSSACYTPPWHDNPASALNDNLSADDDPRPAQPKESVPLKLCNEYREQGHDQLL